MVRLGAEIRSGDLTNTKQIANQPAATPVNAPTHQLTAPFIALRPALSLLHRKKVNVPIYRTDN